MTVAQLGKIFLLYYGTRILHALHWPLPEQAKFSAHTQRHFLKIYLIIILSPISFYTKILYAFLICLLMHFMYKYQTR